MPEGWHVGRRLDGRVEVICPHGVGHPSKRLTKVPWQRWMDVHGCDGCCLSQSAAFALAELAAPRTVEEIGS